MPIYEYGCEACGKVFEYIQKMSDDPKTTCESCGGPLQRLISRSAFHLKGGGWYKDLYSSTKPSDSSKSSASSDSSTSSSSSSDSKSSSGGSGGSGSSGD